MKKHCLLILFILFVGLSSYAQGLDELLNVKYKAGFAILNKGDTLRGAFEFNDCQQNYQLLVYIDPISKKKTGYNPNEVKFFSFEDTYYIPKELKEGWRFVQLISNDSLKVYLHKRFITTDIGSGSENQIMYEKPNGEYLLVSLNKFYPFSTKVGDFFSDYAELSKKIRKNIYSKDDALKIALEYNNWLKKKKK